MAASTPNNFDSSTSNELSGYIQDVSPIIQSQKRNKYYDVQLQTGEATTRTIRVMETQIVKRKLFVEKETSKSPVKMLKLTNVSNKLPFFNPNVGSKMEEIDILSFPFVEQCKEKTVADVIANKNNLTMSFNVTGAIKWANEERKVAVGDNAMRAIRDAILQDSTGNMKISIWENFIPQIKDEQIHSISNVIVTDFKGKTSLSTTGGTVINLQQQDATNINWGQNELLQEITRKPVITNTFFSTATMSNYTYCSNNSCKKKILPYSGEKTVQCSSCRKVMLVKRCKTTYMHEVTVDHDEKQLKFVIFPDVIERLFPTIEKDQLLLNLLSLDNIDIEYNERNVITNITTMM